MFGTEHLAIFVVTGILLNLTPGQDTLYILGRSVAQGRRAGTLSVLGIVSGSAIHTIAAAFGFSAILASSTYAFTIVKFAGAGYLTYLGLRMLLVTATKAEMSYGLARESDWKIYRAGLVTNVLNPKVALFFMAFLPQFVSPAAESRILAFLFLGGLFILTGTAWCMVLVWSAAAITRRLELSASSGMVLKRLTGTAFIGLGLKLALNNRSQP